MMIQSPPAYVTHAAQVAQNSRAKGGYRLWALEQRIADLKRRLVREQARRRPSEEEG